MPLARQLEKRSDPYVERKSQQSIGRNQTTISISTRDGMKTLPERGRDTESWAHVTMSPGNV